MSEDLLRSWLFVPGDRPERFAKAAASGADAVIIDLEDAVPAAAKQAARGHARQWLEAGHPAYLRINACGSAWCDEDLALAGLARGVILPKAEQVGDIARVMAAGARCVLPLIESALGMWQAHDLARQPGVQRLVFGNIDFALDLGINGEEDEPLLHFRSQLVLVSRVAGILPPVDGVTTNFSDEELLRRDSLRARRMGFGGKLCIHPRQVAAVNVSYAPTAAEIEWARQVEQAAATADGAAVALHGKMIDLPVILRAKEILRESERLASRTQ